MTRECIYQLTLLMMFLSLVGSTAAQRSSYGQACSKTMRCDRRSWLGCFNGTCDCVKPEEMTFEPTTGKCASKAGERCMYALEHSDGSKAFEVTNCVENSSCSDDGFCSCDDGYYENANSTCIPKGKFGEPCDERAVCSERFSLICKGGKCECDEVSSVYSESHEQCVGLAGLGCVDNKCLPNAMCSNKKCVCGASFYQAYGGQCVPRLKMNQPCTFNEQCKYGGKFTLKCVEGSCQCDPETSMFGTAREHQNNNCNNNFHAFVGQPREQCIGKVNHPCIEGLCAAGTYCSITNCQRVLIGRGVARGTCQCQPGYSESLVGTCGTQYGESCHSPRSCFDGLVCLAPDSNYLSNLYCRCRYSSQDYDSSKRKCVSPIGGPCDSYSTCTQNAICKLIRNSSKGMCECKGGYVEGTFGECKVAYAQPCNGASPCDEATGLQCIEEICQCKDFKTFCPQLQKCVGLVGSFCSVGKGNDCVDNSSCRKILDTHNDDRGRCACLEGFSVNDNYTCESDHQLNQVKPTIPVLSFPAVYDVENLDED